MSTGLRLIVCLPVYNEAEGIRDVLTELAAAVANVQGVSSLDVVLVDDGSRDNSATISGAAWENLPKQQRATRLHVVTMASNQGHQRALLCGLRYAAALDANAVVVMDADGQDDPGAIEPMLRQLESADIVFARRSKRAEGFIWVLAYHAYQALSRVLLGQTLFVGNFCMVRAEVATLLSRQGDMTHLAATLSSMPFKHAEVPVARRARLAGETKMSFLRLLDYAVAAMTASSENWIRFFSRLSLLMGALSSVGMVSVVLIRVFTNLAISGWASVLTLLMLVVSLQSLGFLVIIASLRRLTAHVAPYPVPQRKDVLVFDATMLPDLSSKRAG